MKSCRFTAILIVSIATFHTASRSHGQTVNEVENDGQSANNTTASAQLISQSAFVTNSDPSVFGAMPTARILGRSSGSDVDFFRFSAPAGPAYFDIDFAAPLLDTYLALFDANGTLLADNEDSFAPDLGSTTDRDAFIGTIDLSGGMYFIAVATSGNFANATFTGGDPIELFRPDGAFGGFAFPSATPGDASFASVGPQTSSESYSLAITVVPAPGVAAMGMVAVLTGSLRRNRR